MPPWLNDIIFNAPKHVWKTLERICIAMFTTRATVPLGLMVVLYNVVNKLDSKDLKELLQSVVGATWFAALGWFSFACAVIVGVLLFRWREGIFQRELNRIQEVKDKVVKGQLELRFPPQT